MKRHLRNRIVGLAAGTVTFGVISACGGGGSDLGIADGGIRGTGSSVGPVSGFGSVFVNGVKFNTDSIPNQEVESDDGIEFETDLRKGMILRIEGQWRDDGTGTADQLIYDDTLRGPVDQVVADPSGAGDFATLTVMGQSVRVNRQTFVRGTTYATLLSAAAITEHVRVSAWRQADGSYRAGYIETIAVDATDVELEGQVSAVDVEQNRFTIGTITVEYDEDSVSFGSGLTEPALGTATILEVEGSLAGNVLTASTIDRADGRRFSRNAGEDIQLTATIDASYTASGTAARPGEFRIGEQTIRVTDATELDDDLEVSDLNEGLLVQVEGEFLSDNVIEAEKIELRDGNAKVDGVITSAADNVFLIGGVEVRVLSTTAFTVEGGFDMSFETLPIGTTTVEVEGVEKQQGTDVFIEALKVQVDDEAAAAEDRIQYKLEGKLAAISPGAITILGVTIDAASTSYADNSQAEITSRFGNGEVVILKVEYVRDGDSFTAVEIELEDNDDD
ncbi:hypothetical protein LPB19_00135 [Marinobacter salinisoli]|uniref:DUF5666 domain-containing protein n=1 Tax=Marinobacter salinisoli TaxID=2769486 RepID=A0ABX7MU19_9GAMM|nr:DUF5666 domain-containing protein [Marinobacter salinisoli]QSP94874.1 hypothetical protein LPB19_00135 [Marinobacter salinisoli]